jgi:hypothetical protein
VASIGIPGQMVFAIPAQNQWSLLQWSIMEKNRQSREAGVPELSRRVSAGEYLEIVEYAQKLGLDCGCTQDHSGLGPGKDEFIPDFNKENVFKYYKD